VTPEAAAFIGKARGCLDKAPVMLAQNWPDEAGRTAYLAGFHAAQAWLFEQRGKVFKTHAGVHAEFARLVKDDARFGLDQRRLLSRTYNIKAIADYGTDWAANVTPEQAVEAIDGARRYVATIAALLGAEP
jgi:uncharacterized protein (UPF0332 family)